MASDGYLDVKDCYLIPGRFGAPSPHIFGGLLGGITGSSHHNVVAAEFDMGTVISMIQKGETSGSREGMTELVYGRYVTQASGPTVTAAGDTCVAVPNQGGNALTTFTNYDDYEAASVFIGKVEYQQFGVIAIGAMTSDYYGWFWSGGVAPEDFASDCTGWVIRTVEDTVVEGPVCSGKRNTALYCGLAPYDDSVATALMLSGDTGDQWYVPMGYALRADDASAG